MTKFKKFAPEDAAAIFVEQADVFQPEHTSVILAGLATTFADLQAKMNDSQQATIIACGAALAHYFRCEVALKLDLTPPSGALH